jgi:hypothetical protein
MSCGCNKKATVKKINSTGGAVSSPQPITKKMPLVTTNTSNGVKKTALANASKKISKR